MVNGNAGTARGGISGDRLIGRGFAQAAGAGPAYSKI